MFMAVFQNVWRSLAPTLRSHTGLRIVSQLFFFLLSDQLFCLFSEAKINTLITPDCRKCAQCQHKI